MIINWAGKDNTEFSYVSNELLDYHLVVNILTMAHEEGNRIKDVEEEILQIFENSNKNDLFVYALTDPYTKHYVENLEQAQKIAPNSTCVFLEDDTQHAFVLTHSLPVAELVSKHFLESQLNQSLNISKF